MLVDVLLEHRPTNIAMTRLLCDEVHVSHPSPRGLMGKYNKNLLDMPTLNKLGIFGTLK